MGCVKKYCLAVLLITASWGIGDTNVSLRGTIISSEGKSPVGKTERSEGAKGEQDQAPEVIQKIRNLHQVAFDKSIKNKVKLITEADEATTLGFAFRNFDSSNQLDARASIRIMAALEASALKKFQIITRDSTPLENRTKRALSVWGRYVESLDAFVFVVDNLLNDDGDAQDVTPLLVGAPNRFSDEVFNLAIDKIPELANEMEIKHLGNLDDIAARDVKIRLFRDWWRINKSQLKQNALGKGFYTESRRAVDITKGETPR
jgi:hypothetical protein